MVAATQFACGWDVDANIANAEKLVRQAAKQGAQIILIQELFETPYFCIEQDSRHLRIATTRGRQPRHQSFREDRARAERGAAHQLLREGAQLVLQFRRHLDADGRNLGVYRKAHIPNGPGYQEKNYFSPGDTGFKVWDTRYARIGVGICWDQWFPECARAMALMGAELLFYPTAIGSEPPPALPVNSRDHWQRTQQGHAAANLTPVIVSNRIGTERALQDPEGVYIRFYGSSFIADSTGAKVAEADEVSEAVLTAKFDLAANEELRNNWFVFRDRRPELYGALTTYDGGTHAGRDEELAEIDALFAQADLDHDGQINFTEFKALVRELDGDMTEAELRIGFTETDVNQNSRINIDEFRAWWLSG